MHKTFEYLRLATLLLGLLIGIQLPGFVDEYGQILQARTLESNTSVSEFQDDADRFFSGSLSLLIEYYKANPDLVFVTGGESIEAIVARNAYLNNAFTDYSQSTANAFLQAFLQPVPEVREQLLDNYQYSVTLNAEAIISGVALAILCMMVLELLGFGCRKCVHLIRKPRARKPVSPPRP